VIRSGGGQGEKILGGMWLYFAEIYGEGFHGRFFRAANGLPAATSLNDAIANYELAASVAAGENLYGVFVATLKYPEIPGLSDRILQTLEHRARPVLAHDDAFAIFHDAQDMRLDLLGNDPGAPDGQTRLTIIAVDGPDPQGRATVARGGSHIAYTPRPGFYGTETWTYTVADAFGNVDDARVVMDVSKRWQNPLERHDVNGDGTVTPLDVLLVINAINSGVLGSLPAKPTGALAWLAYLDATGDGQCTPGDVLTVINRLNSRTTSAVSVSVHGEGEAGAAGVLDRAGTDSWERAWLSESRAHLEDVLRPWDRLPACLSCPV
jgi:hypothetical protein